MKAKIMTCLLLSVTAMSCAPLGSVAKTSVSPSYRHTVGMKAAVLPFTVTGYPEARTDEASVDTVTMALLDCGFTVVERGRLKSVTDELKLDLSGMLSAEDTKRIGQLLQAEVIVLGNVSVEYVPARSSGGSFRPFLIGPATTLESRKEGHYEEISAGMRLVDVKTGEVLATSMVRKKESSDMIAELAASLKAKLASKKPD